MDQVTQSTAVSMRKKVLRQAKNCRRRLKRRTNRDALQALVGGGSEQHGGAVASTHRLPAPAAPVPKRCLDALISALSRHKARASVVAAVPAGLPHRSSFPIEENF